MSGHERTARYVISPKQGCKQRNELRINFSKRFFFYRGAVLMSGHERTARYVIDPKKDCNEERRKISKKIFQRDFSSIKA